MTTATANDILTALQKRTPQREMFFAGVNLGPAGHGLRTMDAIWFRKSWTRPRITGFEVKISRSDFLRDDKWPEYAAVCVLSRNEIPGTAGLMVYNPESGALSVQKGAPHTDRELDQWLLMYLVMSKTEPKWHPFYSSEREYLEAWVDDKADRKALGRMVGTRLALRLEDLEIENDRLKRDVERLRETSRAYNEIVGVLRKERGWRYGTSAVDQFKRLLAEPIPLAELDEIERGLQQVQRAVKRLRERKEGAAS